MLVVSPPALAGGPDPTAEFVMRPVPPKVGVYPPGTVIVGDELRAPYGGFRAWFDVYVRNWDPNQDDFPKLQAALAKSDGEGLLGANAVPPNPDVNLTIPYPACTTDSDCELVYGEPGAMCYPPEGGGTCFGTYQGTTRSDWFCADDACAVAGCDAGSGYGLRCFAVAARPPGPNAPPGFFHDDGTEKYLATMVLDIPLGATGRYTIAFIEFETALDDTAAPPERIPTAAQLPAYIVIEGGDWDCYPPDSLDVPKNRAISLKNPASPGTLSALRVTMIELQNPVPPNVDESPPPDFSAYESGPTCADPGGCQRWVGEPGPYHECQPGAHGGLLRVARLQCTPYYYDWSQLGLFHVVGAEILPSSTYDVEVFPDTCMGNESTCPDVSAPIHRVTSRHGDVAPPFNPPSTSQQPDVTDITSMVSKFKCQCLTSTKAQMQLQPNMPEVNLDLTVSDIVSAVDAYKSFAYSYGGPCPCPSTVPCNVTPCSAMQPCAPTYGPESTCVRMCVGGYNEGDPCIYDTNCGGGTCGGGYCRDRCGRCNP